MDELTPLQRRILEQLAIHRGLTTAMICFMRLAIVDC